MERWAIDIDRHDITRATIVRPAAAPPSAGEAAFRVDLVALTANNVTYAALGGPGGPLGADVGYWDFFGDRDAPGRLPVWGFATVAESRVEGLGEGEQLYGYWPLASHVTMRPERVGAVGFTDATERRRALPAFYNNYQRIAALDDHAAEDHALWPVWRPLQVTGWLVADQLADAGDHDAAQVLVTAASSKTALGFAAAMRERGDAPRVIALTSPRSEAFVGATGLYDAVVTYDTLDAVARVPSAVVDFANDAAVIAALRARLGDALRLDLLVGFTHWESAGQAPVAGVPRSGFFAPARIARRAADWGGAGLRERMGAAWRGFMPLARALTRIEELAGAEAALAAWERVVTGRADPSRALLLRP